MKRTISKQILYSQKAILASRGVSANKKQASSAPPIFRVDYTSYSSSSNCSIWVSKILCFTCNHLNRFFGNWFTKKALHFSSIFSEKI